MGFKVEITDSLKVRRLKLLYLTPLALIFYPFMVIYLGIIEVGNPLEDIVEAWKRRTEDA